MNICRSAGCLSVQGWDLKLSLALVSSDPLKEHTWAMNTQDDRWLLPCVFAPPGSAQFVKLFLAQSVADSWS